MTTDVESTFLVGGPDTQTDDESDPQTDDESDPQTDLSLGLITDCEHATAKAREVFTFNIGRPGKSIFYTLIVNCLVRPLAFFYKALHPLQIIGQENFPLSGPIILLSNHEKSIDPFLLVSKIHQRAISAINKKENFCSLQGLIIRGMGQIPFDRDGGTVQNNCSLDIAAAILREGGAVAYYPEGTRTLGVNTMWHPMIMYGLLKRIPDVPIVSMSIHYTRHGWRRPVTIKIGLPEIHNGPHTAKSARAITEYHRSQVVAMSGLPDQPDRDAFKDKYKSKK